MKRTIIKIAPVNLGRLVARGCPTIGLLRVGQGIAVLSGFVAAFGATSWLLADASREHYSRVVFASAENWPEIKNGVPELSHSSLSSITSEPKLKGLGGGEHSERAVGMFGPPEQGITSPTRPAVDALTGEAAQQSSGRGNLVPAPSPKNIANSFLDFAAVGVPTTVRSEYGHLRQDRMPVHQTPRSTAGLNNELTPGEDAGIGKRAKQDKVGDKLQEKAKGIERTNPRALPLPAKARRSVSEVNRAHKTKLANVQRVRTAATPVLATSTPSAHTRPAAKERTSFLGIPLPTGGEIKQCLFEFRC
jgi:hypothetical protein